MKKFTVLILFVFLFFMSALNAFSKSRFYDLPYGDYRCYKDGETCDYYIYENTSGSQGRACPKHKQGADYDVEMDVLADFLSSKYCYFTPTRVKKYNCYHSFGHITIYRKDGRVISVTGSFPRSMDIQDTYQPDKCTEVQMEGGGNLPVNYKPAYSRNLSSAQNSNFDVMDNSVDNQVSQSFIQTIIPEHSFLIFFVFIIAFLAYVNIYARKSKHFLYGNYFDSANFINISHNPKLDRLFIIKAIVVVLTSLLFLYFHPTEEVLKCNESGICNIKQTYFGLFNIEKNINVDHNSRLSCSSGMHVCDKEGICYGSYIRIDGKAPFVFYVDSSHSDDYSHEMQNLENSCNKEVQKFNDYKKYPELYQYTIKSKADVLNLIFGIMYIALFIYFISIKI